MILIEFTHKRQFIMYIKAEPFKKVHYNLFIHIIELYLCIQQNIL